MKYITQFAYIQISQQTYTQQKHTFNDICLWMYSLKLQLFYLSVFSLQIPFLECPNSIFLHYYIVQLLFINATYIVLVNYASTIIPTSKPIR